MDSDLIFDTIIPLPYRILFLIQLGHLLWYLIVYGCYIINHMNVLQLINMSYSSHNYSQLGEHLQLGELATITNAEFKENDRLLMGIWSNLKIISINTILSFVTYKAFQFFFDQPVIHLIPLFTILLISYKIFIKSEKSVGKLRIFSTMKRILLGNINSHQMRTNDILISDSLVSYAKVLNDIGIFIWHYFVSEANYNNLMEFLVLCSPSFIRIRQCYNELSLTGQQSHLLNLIKYASGILPIFMNFLIKWNIDGDVATLKSLSNAWYVFLFITSTYSFIWDVKMDWGFNTIDYLLGNNSYIIRNPNKLVYRKPVYFSAIFLDFVLRYLWVLKLCIGQELTIQRVGQFLFGYDAFSFGYCLIETLEIFRRFMWCFFKLENDWFKLETDIEMTKVT